MTTFGYFLCSEEHGPRALVDQAQMAEQAGFDALWVSGHYHPWTDRQGQSPFVWGVLGALSQVCRLPVTTAVTCPTTRMHPAVVAHAAATAAVQREARFTLGVGTGEALNEHILGTGWPSIDVRLDMLAEAVGRVVTPGLPRRAAGRLSVVRRSSSSPSSRRAEESRRARAGGAWRVSSRACGRRAPARSRDAPRSPTGCSPRRSS